MLMLLSVQADFKSEIKMRCEVDVEVRSLAAA